MRKPMCVGVATATLARGATAARADNTTAANMTTLSAKTGLSFDSPFTSRDTLSF